MNVNLHNYEAFFLDYVEGNLSAEVVAELILFLEENPLLKVELDDFSILEISPVSHVSFNKESLKVHVNKTNVEGFIVGSLEGINSQTDEEELAEFVKTDAPSLRLLNRYKNTILVAPEVNFPKKDSLKKRSRVIVLYPLIGAVASFLIFFMISNGTEQQEYNPQAIIAAEASSEVEEESHFIFKETPVILENGKKEENNSTPIKVSPIEENYIAPRQNMDLALELKDSSEVLPLEIETPIPDVLIVVNETSNIPKTDLATSFDEPSNSDLTMNEWANHQIRNKVLNQESDDVSKIKTAEVLNAIVGGLNKVSKQEIAYNNTSNEGYTAKGFSVGKFEFYRTKRNKL